MKNFMHYIYLGKVGNNHVWELNNKTHRKIILTKDVDNNNVIVKVNMYSNGESVEFKLTPTEKQELKKLIGDFIPNKK